MIEDPCKKCEDPAMNCSNTCGDLAEYRYIKELEETIEQQAEYIHILEDTINQYQEQEIERYEE